MRVESLVKPRDSTSVLKALPGKLGIENTHLVSSIYKLKHLQEMPQSQITTNQHTFGSKSKRL